MSGDWLPPLLREIADVAGEEAALRIAEARGGARVFIPAQAAPDHWLTQAVGPEAAAAICAHFRAGEGGLSLDLPLGPHSAARRTARRVDEMIREGVPANEIARQARVHRTTVFRRKAAMEGGDDRQGELFGGGEA